MDSALNDLLTLVVSQYLFDVEVMSEPVMYWPFLIPISIYLVFFFMKWAVLSSPLWLPFAIIILFVKD